MRAFSSNRYRTTLALMLIAEILRKQPYQTYFLTFISVVPFVTQCM